MNRFIKLFAAVAMLVMFSQLAFAQPPPPATPAAVPIDGGLGFLLAAGAGLGAKKAWDLRKQKNQNDE